jgi:hypothetical protein
MTTDNHKSNRKPPKSKRLQILAVRLDDATMEALKAIAEAEMRPAANLGALLIMEGLQRRKKPPSTE